MNDELKQLWKTYFGRSPEWAEKFTPSMSNAVIGLGTDIYPGETISDVFTKRIMYPGTKYDIPLLVEYIEHPEKCVKYPFVANMARQAKLTDGPWIKDLVRSRARNWEELERLIDHSAEELSHPIPCYDKKELFGFVENLIKSQGLP